MRLATLLLVLLAAPSFAQDAGAEIEARFEACVAGLDLEAMGGRAEEFADARGYDTRVAGLCAADDRDGASAFADNVEAEFYAQDAEATRVRACVVQVFGHEPARDHVCDR